MEGYLSLKSLYCKGTTSLPTILPKCNKRYSIIRSSLRSPKHPCAEGVVSARAISFWIPVMFPELSNVGVSRFHTMHIAFRGSRKRFSAKIPTIACAQRQSDTWSKIFRDTCNASEKHGSRLSISNNFLHDHGLRKPYRIELFVRHSEANCRKTG